MILPLTESHRVNSLWDGLRLRGVTTIPTVWTTAFLFCTWMVANERRVRHPGPTTVRLLRGHGPRDPAGHLQPSCFVCDCLSRRDLQQLQGESAGFAFRS